MITEKNPNGFPGFGCGAISSNNNSTGRKLRILVLTFTRSSLGHLNRCLSASLELTRRGHEVLFGCSEQTIHIPRATGLNCAVIHELEPMPQWAKIRDIDELKCVTRTRLANPEYLKKCLDDETKLINLFKPDLVISDMRNTAGVAAAISDVPSISIHNTRLFVYPLSVIIPLVIESMESMGIEKRAIEKIFGDVMIIPDYSFFEPLKAIPEPMLKLITASVREIHHTGPLLRCEPSDLPSKSELRKKLEIPDTPFIYITFGGSPSGHSFLRMVLSGLVNTEAHYVIVTGPNVSSEMLIPLIEEMKAASKKTSITVFDFTDHALEYMKAADVAIIHGGHGTTMEGILCGTPLIVIPHNAEQSENAQRSVELGTGRILHPNEIKEKLSSRIYDFLEDKALQKRCIEVSTLFSHSSGIDKLSYFIENSIWLKKIND